MSDPKKMITTDAVVISRREAGDSGFYLTVLSPDMGLLDVTVRGAKKYGASNSAASQLFSCSRLCLSQSKGRYYINSSEPVRSFYGLRLDMQKLALASYFAQIVSHTVTENQTANDVYRLFTNSLYMLSERSAPCGFVKFVFEMRICADLGLMPGLIGCADCYRTEPKMYFLIKEGILLCPKDAHIRVVYDSPDNVMLTAGMIEALRHVCLSEMEKIFSFRVSDEALVRLGDVSERYICYHMGRHFDTLDIYRSLQSGYI